MSSFAACVLALLCCPATETKDLPDPRLYLDAAKSLPASFLFNPIFWNSSGYSWDEEHFRNELDRKGKVLKTARIMARNRPPFVATREKLRSIDAQPPDRVSREFWCNARFDLLGRESLAGRDSVVFAFRFDDDVGNEWLRKFLTKTEGRVWFDEEDRRVVKVEGRYVDGVLLHEGFFASARIIKGERWAWQLKRIDQAWVPVFHERTHPAAGRFWGKRSIQDLATYRNHRRAVGVW